MCKISKAYGVEAILLVHRKVIEVGSFYDERSKRAKREREICLNLLESKFSLLDLDSDCFVVLAFFLHGI